MKEAEQKMNEIKVAVKGVLVKRDRMLVVQRSCKDETGAGTWENVGGVMDFGETFEQALVREFKEEAGLSVEVNRLLYAITLLTRPTRQVVLLTFLCSTDDETVVLSDEHEAYLWASREQLQNLLPEPIRKDFESYGVFNLLES